MSVDNTLQLLTPLNAVTATTTSAVISCKGAKRITWFFKRANHSSGNTVFSVDVSIDGTNFVDYNKLISNVANSNVQDITRVASVTLSSNTTEMYSMDLTNDVIDSLKVTATETTDGTHTAICLIEY